jgi:hypothetical protein
MKTVFAYLIVLLVGRWLPLYMLVGAFFGGVLNYLLFFLPITVRCYIGGLVGGLAHSVLAVAFAYVVFRWLIGPQSFGLLPLAASLFHLVWSLYDDFVKYRQLKAAQTEMGDRVKAITAPDLSTRNGNMVGQLAGVLAAVGWALAG